MFNRASSFAIVLALPLLAAATETSTCNTGPIQCCNSVQSITAPAVTALAASLGISLSAFTGPVGLTCTPITVVGGGGNSCSAQPVCCTNNDFNGLINFGCNSVNL